MHPDMRMKILQSMSQKLRNQIEAHQTKPKAWELVLISWQVHFLYDTLWTLKYHMKDSISQPKTIHLWSNIGLTLSEWHMNSLLMGYITRGWDENWNQNNDQDNIPFSESPITTTTETTSKQNVTLLKKPLKVNKEPRTSREWDRSFTKTKKAWQIDSLRKRFAKKIYNNNLKLSGSLNQSDYEWKLFKNRWWHFKIVYNH